MAQQTLRLPRYTEALLHELEHALPGSEITLERRRKDRYTFVVVSSRFDRMQQADRQSLVWDIAERVVVGPDLWKIGMILTIGKKELPAGEI